MNDIKSYLGRFAFAATILFSGAAAAFPGSLDTNFGCAAPPCSGYVITGIPAPSGVSTGSSLALQSDGKIVMAGGAGSGASQNMAVARFNANGTLDTTFNGSGYVTTAVSTSDDHANSVAIQSDGKIVAAGGAFISSVFNFAVARSGDDLAV